MKPLYLLTIILILISCNNSKKGNWTEHDKERFKKSLENRLTNFGEKETLIYECLLNKAQTKYSTFNDLEKNLNGWKEIIDECKKEVLPQGSVRGKWSEYDKHEYLKEWEKEDLSNLIVNKDTIFNCILNKLEIKYSSLYDAVLDEEGLNLIVLECQSEILSNGSVKGKWSEYDKQSFKKAVENEDFSNISINKKTYIDCVLNKLETNYSSLYEAEQDEKGLEKYAAECAN
jgi:hypothetical protein